MTKIAAGTSAGKSTAKSAARSAEKPADSSSVTSQTLSRGIRILEILAAHGGAMSSAAITTELGLHRSIAYRLLRTLELHRLVVRDDRGHYLLGPRLASLAATVERDLQQAAAPILRAAVDDLGVTCFLVRLDGDEAITLLSVEPRSSIVSVAQHPGTEHPLGVGAPGRAVLCQLPQHEWPETLSDEQRAATLATLEQGYASSHDEVIHGLKSVAVALQIRGSAALAVAAAFLSHELTDAQVAARLHAAAAEITVALEG